MGGEDSEVTDGTTELLLEAANFEPLGILRTSERLALRTAGSNRWEKGVDPYLAENAAVLASRLLVDLAGARMTGHIDVNGGLPERPIVRFRTERASQLIGLDIPADEQRATLDGFGFDVSDDWEVTVPTWRARDVTREVDLIEEVARPVLDRIPHTMPLRRHVQGRLTKEQRLRRVVEDTLVGAGLSEAYTWSLVASDPSPDAIRLPSPMTSEQAILRTTIVPGLVEAARTGVDAGAEHVGAVRDRARLPAVGRAVAGRALARRRESSPAGTPTSRECSRRCTARSGSSCGSGGARTPCSIRAKPPRRRQAGSASSIPRCSRGRGERSSSISRRCSRRFRSGSCTRTSSRIRRCSRTSRSPSTRTSRSARSSTRRTRPVAGCSARRASSTSIAATRSGTGRKSVAIHLAFQSPERTLTEDEATEARERIVAALAERFAAELRA